MVNSIDAQAPLILVIEDHLEWSEALQSVLAKEGYRTAAARDGLEGLSFAQGFKPDLILINLTLPVMDGLEFQREYLKVLSPSERPARLMAYTRSLSLLLQSLDFGAEVALQTPFSIETLLHSVSDILAKTEMKTQFFASPVDFDRSEKEWRFSDSVERVLDQIRIIFRVNAVTLSALRESKLVYQRVTGAFRREWEETSSWCESSPCALVRESRRWFAVNHLEKDPLLSQSQWFQRFLIRSYAGVPIQNSTGQLLGSLALHSQQSRSFSHAEKKLMVEFSTIMIQLKETPVYPMEFFHRIYASLVSMAIEQDQRISVGVLSGRGDQKFEKLPTEVLVFASPLYEGWIYVGWSLSFPEMKECIGDRAKLMVEVECHSGEAFEIIRALTDRDIVA